MSLAEAVLRTSLASGADDGRRSKLGRPLGEASERRLGCGEPYEHLELNVAFPRWSPVKKDLTSFGQSRVRTLMTVQLDVGMVLDTRNSSTTWLHYQDGASHSSSSITQLGLGAANLRELYGQSLEP